MAHVLVVLQGSNHFFDAGKSVLFFVATMHGKFYVSNVTHGLLKNSSSAEGFSETHCTLQWFHCLCQQVPSLASDKFVLQTHWFLLADLLFEFRKDIVVVWLDTAMWLLSMIVIISCVDDDDDDDDVDRDDLEDDDDDDSDDNGDYVAILWCCCCCCCCGCCGCGCGCCCCCRCRCRCRCGCCCCCCCCSCCCCWLLVVGCWLLFLVCRLSFVVCPLSLSL